MKSEKGDSDLKSGILKFVKSVVFLLILGILVMKAGEFLRPMDKDADVLVDFYDMEKDSADVALIGSSALLRYWIPPMAYEEQGFTSSMLYCSGQDVSTVPYLIEELMKTQDPDVILVETRRIITERLQEIRNTHNQARLDYYTQVMVSGMKPSLTKYHLIDEVLKLDGDEKLEYMVPLLKYHENIYEYSMEELLERDGEDLIENTIRLPKTAVEEQKFRLYSEDEYKDYVLTEKYLGMLDDIQEKAQEYGKKVVFLCTPYATSVKGQTLRAQMCEYMDEKGYEYIDLTVIPDEIGLDFKTDFYNGSHTNVSGAKKATSYLARYLMENYEIEAEYSSSVQTFWSEFVDRWHEKETTLMEEWEENCNKIQQGE